ncbi:MAG: serine hydrolase [Actinobacteria bacterium]|nr:serine hydrolase [Actinomycetota bacterium]
MALVAGAVAVPTAAAQPLAPPPQLATDEVPEGWPAAPAVSASSYLLVEGSTGQVLAARDPDRRRPVASTVKILSALTVLARADPGDEVTVPAEAAAVGGATVDLDTGEVWTVGQLLDAVLVRSGNDAAVALALEIGGSLEGFVDLMRADAAALGVEGIELTSPSGLDDANRLSARDLGVLTRAALADTRFREIVGRSAVDLPGVGRQPSRNELLGTYPGATGVKTGFTEAAGYALVASAERGGREVIAVLLDSQSADSRFAEAAALLEHAFGTLTALPVRARTSLRVAGGEVVLQAAPVPLVVPADAAVVHPVLALPVEVPPAGEVREAPVLWDDQELARLSVVVGEATRPDVDGGAALGRAVVDRVYAAMRAATTTGSWSLTTAS